MTKYDFFDWMWSHAINENSIPLDFSSRQRIVRCDNFLFYKLRAKTRFQFRTTECIKSDELKIRLWITKHKVVSEVQSVGYVSSAIIRVEAIFLFCVWLSNRLNSVYLNLILAKYLKSGIRTTFHLKRIFVTKQFWNLWRVWLRF